jgi:hypothetical protein
MCVLKNRSNEHNYGRPSPHFIQTHQQMYNNYVATTTTTATRQSPGSIAYDEFARCNNTNISYPRQHLPQHDFSLDGIEYPTISIPTIPTTFTADSSLSSSSSSHDKMERRQHHQHQYFPPANFQKDSIHDNHDDLEYHYSNFLNNNSSTHASLYRSSHPGSYGTMKTAPEKSSSLFSDQKKLQKQKQPQHLQQKQKSTPVFVITSSTSEEQQQLYNNKTKSNSSKPTVKTVTNEYVLDDCKECYKYGKQNKNSKNNAKEYPINGSLLKNDYYTSDTNHNQRHSNTDVNTTDKTTDTPSDTPRTMIELESGSFTHLRTANETYDCIRTDSYLPHNCQVCCTTIYCIFDASYVLCPLCRVINSTSTDNNTSTDSDVTFAIDSKNAERYCGGVGLGFTYESLIQIQQDIIRCDAVTDALDCNVPEQIGERVSL